MGLAVVAAIAVAQLIAKDPGIASSADATGNAYGTPREEASAERFVASACGVDRRGDCWLALRGPPGPSAAPVAGITAAIGPRNHAVDRAPRSAPPAVQVAPPLLHAVALLATMRTAEAVLWPHPFADFSPSSLGRHWGEAFTMPPVFNPRSPPFEWDGDRWYINVFGHGVYGSEIYLRTRNCGFAPWTAVVFAASVSAVWEFVVEGSGTRPSALDLVYTPIAGMALGEARYQLWRLAGRSPSPVARGIFRAVVDPLGEAERSTRVLGC